MSSPTPTTTTAPLVADCKIYPGENGFTPGGVAGFAIGSLVLQILSVLIAILIITLYHCKILPQAGLNVLAFLCKFVPSLYSFIILIVVFAKIRGLEPTEMRMCGAPSNTYCPDLEPLSKPGTQGWIGFGLTIFGLGKLGLDLIVNLADWMDASVGKWFRIIAFLGSLCSLALVPLIAPLAQVPFNVAAASTATISENNDEAKFCFVSSNPKLLITFVQVQGFLVVFMIPIGLIVGYVARRCRYPNPELSGQVDIVGSLGGASIREKFEHAFPAKAERLHSFGVISWAIPSKAAEAVEHIYTFLNQVYMAFYLMIALILCYGVGVVFGILSLGSPSAASGGLAVAQFFWTGGSSAIVALIFVGYRVIYYGCVVKQAYDTKEKIKRKADDWCC